MLVDPTPQYVAAAIPDPIPDSVPPAEAYFMRIVQRSPFPRYPRAVAIVALRPGKPKDLAKVDDAAKNYDEVVVLKDAGHWAHRDNPAVVAGQIA